ncbi:MAG: 4-hydroxybenzoate octaprenyltransferase [Sodalis sp. (in: enterobacteria)]
MTENTLLPRCLILDKLPAWCHLMRIDKPIGSLLLLWPTLWALWLASMAPPTLKILTVFILGVFFMRAAGCVINDYVDRDIDPHVERTRIRPFSTGKIGKKKAELLFLALIGIAFILVLMLNSITVALSTAALALTLIYPFMKRYTHLAQLVLGIAFSWSIPMAFTAVSEQLPLVCWLLFLANITWTVAYDTQYAMVDMVDDLRIGIKSTAILFGRFNKFIIGLLQLATLILLGLIGWYVGLGEIYYLALACAATLFLWQQKLMNDHDRLGYFRAFLNNNFVGMLIFIGFFLSLLPPYLSLG